MAIKATVFKATLQIADLDRYYYADHTLTIAQHPSDFLDRQILSVN
jgi:uncharacterized protein YaeQ